MSIFLQEFDCELNFNLLLDKMSKYQVIAVNLKGGRNLFNKFNGNPSNSCQDISLKTTNVNLMVAQKEKSGNHQTTIYRLGTTKMAEQKFMQDDLSVEVKVTGHV